MDDVQILRSKVVSQNNIIKSYKSWVNILLGMVNTNGSSYTPNLDFATTIEKVYNKTYKLYTKFITIHIKEFGTNEKHQ